MALAPIDNPTAKPGYKPVQMPMPTPQPASYNPNSLWRNGSRAFFNDQRAHIVGDILTVKVNINDPAQFQDQTQLSRTSTEDTEITNFIGANTIGNAAKAVLPGSVLTASGNPEITARATSTATTELLTNVAAVVTQLLPNGNMVIEGKQEVRLNTEVRELIVAGVVRPEDIQSDNTIELPKSPRRAWLTAAAARSPTFKPSAGASRWSTSPCRSDQKPDAGRQFCSFAGWVEPRRNPSTVYRWVSFHSTHDNDCQ